MNFYGCNFFLNGEDITMKVSELVSRFDGLVTKVLKVNNEISGKISDLQQTIEELRAELVDVTLPPAAVEKIVQLETQLQALDDIVEDEVEEPVEPEAPVE